MRKRELAARLQAAQEAIKTERWAAVVNEGRANRLQAQLDALNVAPELREPVPNRTVIMRWSNAYMAICPCGWSHAGVTQQEAIKLAVRHGAVKHTRKLLK